MSKEVGAGGRFDIFLDSGRQVIKAITNRIGKKTVNEGSS